MLLKEALEYENIIRQYSDDYTFCNINLNVALNIYVKKKNLEEMMNHINFQKVEKLKGRNHWLLIF